MPMCRSIIAETIERKVTVASAIQNHGFVYDYTNGIDSSSDEE